MRHDPESTTDFAVQYKLVRRGQSALMPQTADVSKVSDLVTQVAKEHKTKSRKAKLCAMLLGLVTCFRSRTMKVYDLNPPTAAWLLPMQSDEKRGKKTLVLDLDETLVHSAFEPDADVDITVKVTIDGESYNVYVKIRPGLARFIEELASLYELVAFTASLAKYADPVLDQIDPHQFISHRLFRENCVVYCGAFVKDLGRLGRDISQTAIIDNSPASYALSPANGIPIRSFFDDDGDRELEFLLPLLREMSSCEDVTSFLVSHRQSLVNRAEMDTFPEEERLECNSPRIL